MWIGDVGQDSYEEINFRAAGSTGGVNYGWRCYEGNNAYNTSGCVPAAGYVFPVYDYPNPNPGSSSIIGGIVYRGAAYQGLQGYNISADFYSGTFYTTLPDGAGGFVTSTQTISPTGISDFGETEDGEAYVVSLTANSVYRIVYTPPLPISLLAFTVAQNESGVDVQWQTSREENAKNFEIEYGTDGTSFTDAGSVAAKNIATGSAYSFMHAISYDGTVFYRLKMTDIDGSYKYSNTVTVFLNNTGKNIISPSIINNGVMNINLASLKYNSVELISMNGGLVFKENIKGRSGNTSVSVGKLSPGIYIVRLIGNKNTSSQKIVIQ
jgi:hypothetical protein